MRIKEYSFAKGKINRGKVNSVEFTKNSVLFGLFIITISVVAHIFVIILLGEGVINLSDFTTKLLNRLWIFFEMIAIFSLLHFYIFGLIVKRTIFNSYSVI